MMQLSSNFLFHVRAQSWKHLMWHILGKFTAFAYIYVSRYIDYDCFIRFKFISWLIQYLLLTSIFQCNLYSGFCA